MLRVLRSLNIIPTDETESSRRVGPSILSRKSDAAWRDHGHHRRLSTRRHIVPATQRAGTCVHSSVLGFSAPRRLTNGFPALLHEGRFWEPSRQAPDNAVLRSSLPDGRLHLSDRKFPWSCLTQVLRQ